jgi:ATP/maltotriose-dependent transcriptional regulator MalT
LRRTPRPQAPAPLYLIVTAGVVLPSRQHAFGRSGQAGMAASAAQPKIVRRESRIIERPRLIKLLDDTEARTILLLAPAGYGKTTLARQWAKTLNGAIWVTVSNAHCDVAWLAAEIAEAIDGNQGPTSRAISEHIHARANPQLASRELGAVLAARLGNLDTQWLILDDYHEISSSPEAEGLIATLERDGGGRILITSRVRPRWASGRRFVYGEILEVGRAALAMTQTEVSQILGPKQSTLGFTEQAAGWPAVIGLAAAAETPVLPEDAVPETLHRYLAEELFNRASPALREGLLTLALRGRHQEATFGEGLGEEGANLITEAERLGFSSSDTNFDLHPLLREFLLEKLSDRPDAIQRAKAALDACVSDAAWDQAFALILRFDLAELIEPTVAAAFKPLVRSGRLATLSAFATSVHHEAAASSSPSIHAVLSEAAFRDGNFDLAVDLAETAHSDSPSPHPLGSRVTAIAGQIAFLQGDFSAAEESFRAAGELASDDRDSAEAAFGLALASIFGEKSTAAQAVDTLRHARNRSPVDQLRFISSEVALRLMGMHPDGLAGNLHIDTARQGLLQVQDPRVRSNVAYVIAGALAQKAEYDSAREWLGEFFAAADEFGLEFAMPYANWTLAQIAIGQRRFGEAERSLQSIEDAAARTGEKHHLFNARSLRARLLLQNGEPEAALRQVIDPALVPLIPSWRGEYLATRALVTACLGDARSSRKAQSQASSASGALQVRGLVLAARAVSALREARAATLRITNLFETTDRLHNWDPLVCALRSAPALGDAVAGTQDVRSQLESLYLRIGDLTLARRAGFRTRATAAPRDVLSPRELEVLGLIACGYKNREISRALFIAESTTKVHVRHVLEKLGVRTRAEAVARLKMFEA